jgi:hypothetical protein
MLVSANIYVNFTSWFNGIHNIYWREGTTGPYTGPIPVTCIGGGNPCYGVINVMVDNETCEDVIFEGYIQAVCEPGTNNQIPFSYTFTPTPSCTRYQITCKSVPLLGFSITGAGSIYDPLDPPSTANGGITILGGSGTGVVVTAIVNPLAPYEITGFTFSNYGSGFVIPPTVVIAPPPGFPGEGSVATADAILGYCEGFSGFDCNGFTVNSIPGDLLQPTDTFRMCKTGDAPVLSSEYDVSEIGNCLCDCTFLELEMTSETGSVMYMYTTCDGAEGGSFETGTLNAESPIVAACIVVGSLFYEVDGPGTTVTATYSACGEPI